MKNFLLGILVMIIIGGVAVGAYFFGKQNTTEITPSPVSTSTPRPPSPSPISTVKGESDNELIKQALFKKNNWKESDGITVTVSTNDGTYASGTASAQGGGGYFFAAKVNGVWEIVADGNGVILCSSLTNYPSFPKTLIPECYDQATGKTVQR